MTMLWAIIVVNLALLAGNVAIAVLNAVLKRRLRRPANLRGSQRIAS